MKAVVMRSMMLITLMVTIQVASAQLLMAMKRSKIREGSRRLNQAFAELFRDVYARLCLKARYFYPCALNGIQTRVNIIDDKVSNVSEIASVFSSY
jgi:hypothetical protein